MKEISMACLLAVTTISFLLEIPPAESHRLITNPYRDNEWDSIIVSSDPIRIREKTENHTVSLRLKQVIKAQKRSFDECTQNDFKCLYGNDSEDKDSNQIVDKFLEQYSNTEGGKESSSEVKDGDNAGKSYWSMIDSKTHHHPYEDKNGWVTLDPVPWSASKISKWHPNKVEGSEQQNKPFNYGFTTQSPVQQFWVSGSSFHTQRPTSQWGIGTNGIITDNKPSGFPTESYGGYGGPPQGSAYHPDNNFYAYPGSYNEFQPDKGLKGSRPSYSQNAHPHTYPSNGNGEWVLLSTTKGYSQPVPHRWAGKDLTKTNERFSGSRKIKPVEISRYHEEDLKEKFVVAGGSSSGNRKSDGSVNSDSTNNNLTEEWNFQKTPLQVLYTGSSKNEEPVKTIRRKVRLQVLPSLETTSTSYGGLLEVDSSSQTVDEAQQENEKMKKLKAIANVKKNRIRGYKLVPTRKVTGKGISQNGAITLAAVGAGMIPATMAILVPLALGRRRRSIQGRDAFSRTEYDRMYTGKRQ